MPRVIVIPDSSHPDLEAALRRDHPEIAGTILMNEEVRPEHLISGHAADQLIQRLAWAVCDATDAQKEVSARAQSISVVEHG